MLPCLSRSLYLSHICSSLLKFLRGGASREQCSTRHAARIAVAIRTRAAIVAVKASVCNAHLGTSAFMAAIVVATRLSQARRGTPMATTRASWSLCAVLSAPRMLHWRRGSCPRRTVFASASRVCVCAPLRYRARGLAEQFGRPHDRPPSLFLPALWYVAMATGSSSSSSSSRSRLSSSSSTSTKISVPIPVPLTVPQPLRSSPYKLCLSLTP